MSANRNTNTSANLESSVSNELAPAEAIKRLKPPYCLQIHSVRKRKTDIDGLCAKYIIDGLVKAEILPDDDQRSIKEIRFSQEKGTEEKTIITITSPLNTEPS
jgi:Holliday junction resolvase RusA-like endonuclease